MALSLEQKKAVVEEVAEVARSAHSAVAAEYRGLTVAEMTELREKAKQSGVYLRVVRNTLARRAVEGTEFECVQDRLRGPLVLAFSRDEPGAAARVVRDYAKTNGKLAVSFVAFDGRAMDAPRDRPARQPSDAGRGACNADVGTSRPGHQACSHRCRTSCPSRPRRGRDARGQGGDGLTRHEAGPDRIGN